MILAGKIRVILNICLFLRIHIHKYITRYKRVCMFAALQIQI